MLITSTKNDLVKRLRRLKERSARREMGLHLIEGERLVFDAINSAIRPETIIIEDGRQELNEQISALGLSYTLVSRQVLEAICDTPSPQGICASVYTPNTSPPESYPSGMMVALDALQDPGNLGTILRTADAMGAAGLLLGEGCTDVYSPKAMRAAMGSTYHLPIYRGELKKELTRLQEQGYKLVCGHLRGEERIPDVGQNCVLVIGNEGNGVSDDIAELCELCRLPMYGRAESLNASVAASILIYELAKRMRVGV